MGQTSQEMRKNAGIIYFSPGRRTKHAADEICVALSKSGFACNHYDLTNGVRKVSSEVYKNLDALDLLVIGTPIYIDHMSPPVAQFLNAMPSGRQDVIIFATYGAVGSGSTLLDMANILTDKGYRVIGAAKVVAEHTLTVLSKKPLGRVSPDDPNAPKLQSMVYYALNTCCENNEAHVPANVLDYQPRFMHLMDHLLFTQNVFFRVPGFLPKVVFDPSKCVECGECVPACAAETITDIPRKFDDRDCFLCYECVFRCESKALTVNLKDDFLLRALQRINIFEKLVTQVFYPR